MGVSLSITCLILDRLPLLLLLLPLQVCFSFDISFFASVTATTITTTGSIFWLAQVLHAGPIVTFFSHLQSLQTTFVLESNPALLILSFSCTPIKRPRHCGFYVVAAQTCSRHDNTCRPDTCFHLRSPPSYEAPACCESHWTYLNRLLLDVQPPTSSSKT